MVRAAQPYNALCHHPQSAPARLEPPHMPAIATPLPFPPTDQAAAAIAALGPAAAVAVHPLDRSVWLLVRCGPDLPPPLFLQSERPKSLLNLVGTPC